MDDENLTDPREKMPDPSDGPEKTPDGGNRFLYGMIFGAALAVVCMLAVIFLPGVIRDLTGRGNAGAKVLTDSGTRTKLREVENLIEEYYLYDVDDEVMQDYLFRGAAAGLQDDYASYYNEEELSSVMDSTRGEYYGIGAVIGFDEENDEFYVAQVYEDSPAMEGGLLEDDLLLEISGDSVEGLNLSELVALIKDQETFTMTVYRPETDEELELTITCSDVTPTYVSYEMLDDQVGYLLLTEFTESAVDQFSAAVEDLNSLGMEALVVDLRDNPGGLLNSVCDILDEILPEEMIVYTEDKNGERNEYFSEAEHSVDCPVAVLVDGGSASAAEIFAGAVQDYGIGPIVGSQTFGKGVVQNTFSLSDGTAFKLTVETYYTPDGQEIDGNGITPDFVIEQETEETGEEETEDSVLQKACAEVLLWERTDLTGEAG